MGWLERVLFQNFPFNDGFLVNFGSAWHPICAGRYFALNAPEIPATLNQAEWMSGLQAG